MFWPERGRESALKRRGSGRESSWRRAQGRSLLRERGARRRAKEGLVAGESAARAGGAEPDAHEVGAVREEDILLAAVEAEQGVAVAHEEGHQAAESLDPLPLVLGTDPGVEDAAGLSWRRPVGVALLEDAVRAEHLVAARLALRGGRLLELVHARDDERPEGLDRLEPGRRREDQRRALGHGAVLGEVVAGARDELSGLTDEARVGPDAGPLPAVLDEVGGGGVGEGIGDLLDDVLRGGEGDGAVAGGGPEALPAAVEGVEGLGDDAVEEVAEVGEVGAGVGEDEVVVVAHDAHRVDEHPVASGGDGEDELEDEAGEDGGLEEELALRAAPRDEVGGAGDDAPGSSHEARHGRTRASCKRAGTRASAPRRWSAPRTPVRAADLWVGVGAQLECRAGAPPAGRTSGTPRTT